jgi:hypothetical protein
MVTEIDEQEDEIAILAREKMILGHGCHDAIDRNIADAEDAGRWDDLHKWYRVRLRAQRMRQEMNMNYALEIGTERRNAVYAAKR